MRKIKIWRYKNQNQEVERKAETNSMFPPNMSLIWKLR